MALLFGSLIYIILGIACTIGLLLHFKRDKKIKCKHCSSIVHSSQIKCKNCGDFINKNKIDGIKLIKSIEKRVDSRYDEGLKKLDRFNTENRNYDITN